MPGNKAAHNALRTFVEKAADLLDKRIHLLILDLHPPGRRDPQGIHGAIWEDIAGEEYTAPSDKPLTLASYESGLTVRANVVPVRVADVLPEMPLFLEPEKAVMVPLEETYQDRVCSSAAPLAPRPRRTVGLSEDRHGPFIHCPQPDQSCWRSADHHRAHAAALGHIHLELWHGLLTNG